MQTRLMLKYVEAIPATKEAMFDAIVDENAWELAGEGFRKFEFDSFESVG